jgi:hypothetical protein
MPRVEKISLYDFAKMVLGGREPASVSILDANTSEEINKISYFGTGDSFESLRFSQEDFFSDITKLVESAPNDSFNKSQFPGLV